MASPAPEVPAFPAQQGARNGFDPQQVQQMSAMMAMAAAGMTTGMGMPSVVPSMAQSADPMLGLEPAMAQVYAQMFAQYLQQAQAQAFAGGLDMTGMAMVPPAPLIPPSMGAPYSQTPVAPVIAVSVDGMKFQYQLTEEDLHKVFNRYGAVKQIKVDETGTTAQIEYQEVQHAQAAMNDLNGKVLNGLEGTLRLVWASAGQPPAPAPAPYPAMPQFPGAPDWGFASLGMPAWPGAAAPDLGSMLAMGSAGVAAAPAPPLLTSADAGAQGEGGGAAAAVATTAGGVSPADSRAPVHTKAARKHTCRFLIGIENDKDFQVVRRIIGSKGANMKRVVKQTEAKLRLRGVGSGYFEGAGQKESSEPLQLCVSCTSSEGYQTAVKLVEELLEGVYAEYRQFCKANNKPEVDLHATPQLVSGGASTRVWGGAVGGGPADDGSSGEGESPSKKDSSHRRGRRSRAKKAASGKSGVERGEPPPKAPPADEIERCIDQRNEARRQCNFTEADRIRDSLHERGVALMDEPGARGKGSEVTTWRYWRD